MKPLFALATTALALILPPTAGAAMVGTTKVHPPVTTNTAGIAQAYRFTAASSGRLDRLNVFLDATSTASKVEVALYSGTASSAGKRRGRCVISNPMSNAWNRCSVTAYPVTAGANYWLALLHVATATSAGRMQYREGQVSGGPVTYLAKSKGLSSLPSSWTNGSSWGGGYQASIYADDDDDGGSAAPAPTPTPTPTPTPMPPTPSADADGDGVPDSNDQCPGTPAASQIDATGCPTSSPPPPPSGGSGCALPARPDASCTGVPAGTLLTAYSGPSTVSAAGTVISGKSLGCISVKAAGVVIRNSKISCAGTAVMSGDGAYSGTPLLIEDSEIDCKNTGGTAIGEANVTARRIDISGCENGFDVNEDVTVEDSYIHDLYNGGDAHTDGIQLASGHFDNANGDLVAGALDVTIRHNTIYGVGADGSLGTSAIISNSGGDTNVLIQDNLMAGGAYTLYCEQHTRGTNYRVINNHFSRKFSPKVGAYGPSTDCSDETQSGNLYHETMQPVSLN